MTASIVSCPPSTPTSKAREIMTAHQIRHLPIVDNEVVVGIFSVRDLMQQQLLEDRAAAKEVAMLSACLKSIDLNEAAEIVTKEVPKLFQAQKCVLCLFKDNSMLEKPKLLSCNQCLCPKENMNRIGPEASILQYKTTQSKKDDEEQFTYDTVPDDCHKLGVQGPRLVIPLKIVGHKGRRKNQPTSSVLLGKKVRGTFMDIEDNASIQNEELIGYLCMCGLDNSSASNRELTCYKARLTKEILTSHLTNASLYQYARLTSLTDALTGVGSRKLLEDKLQAEAARAKRYKHPFSVAIIDLDNFKTINDVLGHATGDDALRKLAECMKIQKRTSDILARYGGDEFVILMPETKATDAFTLLDRIRTEVQEIHIAENISMTISCGIAQSLPESNDSSSDIIRRADLALYEAKSTGRNCVKCWDKSMSKLLSPDDIEIEKIKKLKRRIAGLSEQAEKMFIQSIWGLVQALEAKDPYARKHSENVMHYAVGIAETMNVPSKQIDIIRRAAMIHDIGKIGIPDAILSKPDKLTPRERSIIEQHPLIAVRILEKMSFLEQEVTIVRGHHEKWNGQGYPDGLSEDSIPLGARILAVADTFDAITSNRAYHSSRPLENAIEILIDSSEYDFDPEVVKNLVTWIGKIRKQINKVDQITPEDILDSQKQLDNSYTAELVANSVSV
jgi:diguanylate cyclase (GGDEF)-like protein/putative nucleotidyltransferase with HDIG domain